MAITDILSNATNAVGSISSAVGTASRLGSAIEQGLGSGDVLKALRAIDLPAAGEAIGDIMGAVASFQDNAHSNDWRARLSLSNWTSFRNSPVLQPLKDAGGLIFPYTPEISMSSSAEYTPIPTTHTNFTFQAYKNSNPGEITITAPMNVEDATQGLYWIAAVHYLRSLTKMFTGNDPKAGNPPPVVYFNAYGNYVFKNIPCVVHSFSTTLKSDCDYISVNVVGSAAGELAGITDQVGGLAGAIGSAIPGVSSITSAVGTIAGGVGQVASLAGSFGLGGKTSGGVAHVPTKSTFTVKLMPIYSRNSARNFSLDRFVQGGYLNNPYGYI